MTDKKEQGLAMFHVKLSFEIIQIEMDRIFKNIELNYVDFDADDTVCLSSMYHYLQEFRAKFSVE